MMTFIRNVTTSQWIMLTTLVSIGMFMMLASRAEAYYHIVRNPAAQTISHCGWVQANNRLFYKQPRNVRIIQAKLEQMGYSVGRHGIDGRYGPDTRRAVRRFQNNYDLAADGQVGTNTATTLAYVSHPIRNVRRCQYDYSTRQRY